MAPLWQQTLEHTVLEAGEVASFKWLSLHENVPMDVAKQCVSGACGAPAF